MRLGTDIIEIARIQQAVKHRAQFANRVLAPLERELFKKYPPKRAIEFLAGRFSAKEAYGKALKTGIGTQLRFHDVCILPDETGAPIIVSGPVKEKVHISISHSQDYATATVIIDRPEVEIHNCLKKYKKLKKEESYETERTSSNTNDY